MATIGSLRVRGELLFELHELFLLLEYDEGLQTNYGRVVKRSLDSPIPLDLSSVDT